MGMEEIVWWIVVGLVAGWLASLIVGGPYGLIGDIVVGIVGAFIGSKVFQELKIATPFGGLAGRITVAFVGAVILLIVLRLIFRLRRR